MYIAKYSNFIVIGQVFCYNVSNMNSTKIKSFTLIEILITIIIIGILASLILFSTQDAYDKKDRLEILNFTESLKAKNLNSLISEWTFDGPTLVGSSATNSDVKDSWGYNHGDVIGHAPTVKGGEDCVSGKCLLLNGSSNYINCGNASNLKINNGSASAWIKASSASGHRGIIVKQSAYGAFLYDNVFVIYDWSGGGNRSTGMALNDNKWHLITFTFQSGVANGTKLYIDGKLKLTTTFSIVNQNVSLVIGAGSPGLSQLYNGFMDEISIYKEALSISQIKRNYVVGLNSMLQSGAISKEEYNQKTLNLAKND